MSAPTLLQLFYQNYQEIPDEVALQFRRQGLWSHLTWRQFYEEVRTLALGLKSLGVPKGGAVGILANTCVEWTLADLAILSLGGVTVPIYQSSTAEQVAYILENAEVSTLFVEDMGQAQRIDAVKARLPQLKTLIVMKGEVGETAFLSWEAYKNLGAREDVNTFNDFWKDVGPKDLATIIYTSGTTGTPKGVMLDHANLMGEVEACHELMKFPPRNIGLAFLPLAHVLSRAIQFFQLKARFITAYAESIDKLGDDMREIRPHFMVAVPRIFEKVYAKILKKVETSSALRRKLFYWAVGVGRQVSQHKQRGAGLSPFLFLQKCVADLLVLKKIRSLLGGRFRFSISGGAPLSQEIAEFFHAVGFLILEGYGLTETFAAVNCNSLEHYRFGTVGQTMKGVEEKIEEDGEILIRGPMIFRGYWKRPEDTREVLSDEGWLRTGDIGKLDAEGFLKITDRKKDIIVMASGKNIAPQNIENHLKTGRYISQALVIGDRHHFLSALVTLNEEEVKEYARLQSIAYRSYHDLLQHPKIYELIQGVISEKNKSLASFETIKKFAILDRDLTQEGGDLTPTLKVKRRVVSQKYKTLIEQFYNEKGGSL